MYKFKRIEEINNGKQISYINGKIAIMCERCYNIKYADINLSMDIKTKNIFMNRTYEMECDNCDDYTIGIELDPNIAEIISTLNKKGYKTKYCCEGHDTYSDSLYPYIYFNERYNNIILNIIKRHPLPKQWYVDKEDLKQGCLIIRSDLNTSLTKRINTLKEWAYSIEKIN